jgi:mono/diheme cytochrome c family protein
MRRWILGSLGVVAGGFALAGSTSLLQVPQACAQQSQINYAEDIAPIFNGWCVSCHQPGGKGYEASGFDVRTYQGVMKGSKFGPMVIAGRPDESNLVVLINGQAGIRMPFNHKPLASCLRQNIWTWIFQGAKND